MYTFSVSIGSLTCSASLPDEAGPAGFSDIANRTVAAIVDAYEVVTLTTARLDG